MPKMKVPKLIQSIEELVKLADKSSTTGKITAAEIHFPGFRHCNRDEEDGTVYHPF
jgi:hypothetical protein